MFEAEARGACRGARVSGGDLCEAEAPTEPAGETKSFSPCPKKALAKASAFFYEIRLSASEILLCNMKYASRVKYLLCKYQADFISLSASAENFTIHRIISCFP